MQQPPWLNEEPELRKLLGMFCDKLDRRAAPLWQQAPEINLRAKSFPRLFSLGEDADRCWFLLGQIARNYQLFDIKLNPKRRPIDPEYQDARLIFNLDAETVLRVWLDRPRKEDAQRAWTEAVQAAEFPGDSTALAVAPLSFADKSPEQIVAAFAALDPLVDQGYSLRQLSARCFWGDSKFLDGKEALVQQLYPQARIESRQLILDIWLPARLYGVLFIENQDSYATLAGNHPELALIYCAGYKGAASRIRESDSVLRQYAGERSHISVFEGWLFKQQGDLPVWFWGDLDYEGMRILKALRQRFAAIDAWRPGYEILLRYLHDTGGHPPAQGRKGEQIDPGATGCDYADTVLLPALRAAERFVDQEIVF
ncbi:MAG: Wadjet anti-phage system protein JetD domain-containing protein [Pseudomonadota bacterium]